MKRFACGDVVPGCSATFLAANEPELLGQVADHAARDHGLTDLSQEMVELVKSHIHAAA